MNASTPPPRCPACNSTKTVKRGKRTTRTGDRQMHLCRACGKHFSCAPLPGFTYPVRAVLSAPLRYYTGYTMEQVQRHITGYYGRTPSLNTVHGWIKRFGALAGLKKERTEMVRAFPPRKLIYKRKTTADRSSDLQVHRYKLAARTGSVPGLHRYIESLMTDTGADAVPQARHHASKLELVLPVFPYRPKSDYALQVTSLAIKTSWSNYQRHSLVEKFFLLMDGSTVAVEVPVYLTPRESQQRLGITGGITGHMDLLQVRGNTVYITDYKPEAGAEKFAAGQLTVYALALSARTGVHLKHIRCGWFDDAGSYAFSAMDGYTALGRRR